MQILLANAKMMHSTGSAELFERAERKPISTPLFQSVANQLAAEMAQMDIDELAHQLDCSPSPDELKAFSYEGFEYSPNHGEDSFPHFIRN